MAEEPESLPERKLRQIDQIAAKYFAVWIWSILIGINTSVAISLLGQYTRARGPFISLLLAPLTVISGVLTILSFYYLLIYLRRYIIPSFFDDVIPELRIQQHLTNAMSSSIFSLAFRLLLSVFDLALSFTF